VNNVLDILKSLKKDLLGRRLLPFVIVGGLALAGGVAYALLGGGSSSAPVTAAVGPALPAAPTTVATAAPANPNVAVSETTSGAHYQRGGVTRDPFIPLPMPKTATTATTPTPSPAPASSGSSPGSGSGSGSGGGTTPTGPSSPPSPAPAPQKHPVYRVALLFGLAPPPGQNPQLTPYADLKRKTVLPSKQNPLLVLTAVGPSGKGAIFQLLQPPILKGPASCLPSTAQCESIDLPVGQTEELSYVSETGQTVTYQLQIVNIAKAGEATTARVASAANRLLAHVAATHHRRGVPWSGADVHRRGPAGGPAAAR
jgi:hypothetical protein